MDASSLLVKPEVAREQIDNVDSGGDRGQGEDSGDGNGRDRGGDGKGIGGSPPQALPKRFHAAVTLNSERVGRDAGKIADEVLSHLSALPDAKVKVTMEIEVEMPDGASEDVQRTVSENAGVLKFDSHGFERD
jgi:hypothetical protein